MYRDIVDGLLGAQDLACQTEILVGRAERHPRETCQDDCAKISEVGVTLQKKRRTLNDMRGRFGELLCQTLKCFCWYDRKGGVLLCPGYNTAVE